MKPPSMQSLCDSDGGAPILVSKSQQNLVVHRLVSVLVNELGDEKGQVNNITIRSSTSRNQPRNTIEYSLNPSSASFFHFAIDDGRYFIQVKNSTK